MDENITMIQISKDTRKKLQDIKITKRESYEEIINRLLSKYVYSQTKPRL